MSRQSDIRHILNQVNGTFLNESYLDSKVSLQRVTKVTNVSLTAEDWQLFEGTDGVAQTLNNVFRDSVNKGMSREEVRRAMETVMSNNSDYGAFDTEPRYILDDLLEYVFGETYTT